MTSNTAPFLKSHQRPLYKGNAMQARSAPVPTIRSVVMAIIVVQVALQVGVVSRARSQTDTRGTLPSACRALDRLANKSADASLPITACLLRLVPRATLSLAPGQYHLRTPLTIGQPVTIETRPPSSPAACRQGDASRCAVLVVGQMGAQPARSIMPVEITASNVTLRSIAIVGNSGRSLDWERQVCLDDGMRPLGGGIRVKATGFRLQNALIRNFSCYTGMEVVATAARPAILNNTIGPNGTHNLPQMWADGVTIHDSSGARVEGNVFHDNTDVQLILGGCRDCIIRRNVFRHSVSFTHASFAELMLHAWPNSSGNFSGSITSKNNIDCGAARRCGYGIMIGGEPWYPARTSGGMVSDNRIASALVALNVDRLTGPMTIVRNSVSQSGGPADSDCGHRIWSAINISPRSVPLARTDAKQFSSMDTAKCILLRHP